MTTEKELLNHIVKSTEMGIDGIKNVLHKATDKEFRKELKSQAAEYEAVRREAYKMLGERGQQAQSIGAFAKFSSEMAVELGTAMDSSSSHLSNMMIKGTSMGITKGAKLMNDYCGKDNEVKGLWEKLEALEERRIERLKSFL